MAESRVLIVDTDDAVRVSLRRCLTQAGYSVEEVRTAVECEFAARRRPPQAILLDHRLPDSDALELLPRLRTLDPGIPVILMLMTSCATIDLAVRAVKEGAEQLLTKPIDYDQLLRVLATAVKNHDRQPASFAAPRPAFVSPATAEPREPLKADPFLGTSDKIRRLEESARRILGTKYPILIEGETGTGKGILALWLHAHGQRSEQAFVDLNCAGLNRELLESELFGYEKGAFTGAVTRKTGILELADRGTVFLDEIGDMDPVIQPKLLKVLEQKQFRRLGGVRECAVDVHLIAATNRDLGSLVATGRFRSDLYFRVNTIPLQIPPLRERREDIRLLAGWFRSRLERELNRGALHIDPRAMDVIEGYDWPGNIRELRNVLERAALVCEHGVIRATDLSFQQRPAQAIATEPSELTIEQLERRHIERVLEQMNGKVAAAAARLGMSRSTLYSRIKQYSIVHSASAYREYPRP